jgi:hypothetical protein
LRYAEFIYATQTSPRLMMAPAGYFCARCPAVIVDEELLRQGVTGNFVYSGVIGINYDDKHKSGPFKTWNGKETIVFVDEVEKRMELLTRDELALSTSPGRATAPSKQTAQKNARRREMARQSRKQNRRKR